MAERPTSFAKSVEGLHHEPSALDQARALRDQFEKAQQEKADRQKSREAERPRRRAAPARTVVGGAMLNASDSVEVPSPVGDAAP